MSTSKILMTGFLWLFLGLMSGCNKSEVMFETGEGARSVGTDTSCEAVETTGGIEVQTVEEKSEDLIYVYVCGQVRTPGSVFDGGGKPAFSGGGYGRGNSSGGGSDQN